MDLFDRHHIERISIYIALLVLSVIILFPVWTMITTSVAPSSEIFVEIPKIIPNRMTLDWYREILSVNPIVGSIFNSFIVATGTMLINLATASLAAYSLSRFKYPGKHLFSRSILFTYMLPPILLVLPLYLTMSRLHLLNTRIGLILTHTTFTLPFSVWLLKGYLDTIPIELDECAMLDGATRLGAFLHIVAPIARPGLAAALTYTFIASWNEYLYSLVLMTSYGMKTLPVKISEFIVETSEIQWGSVMAASMLALIPATLLFQFVQGAFIRGLTAGSLKE